MSSIWMASSGPAQSGGESQRPVLAQRTFRLLDWRSPVADHPRIKDHLSTRVRRSKITTIAYGGEAIHSADASIVEELGLTPNDYYTVIARAEPENSLLEIVRGFSRQPRRRKLAVLGKYDRDNDYHRKVLEAAGEGVVFLGPIYDKKVVRALRYFSSAYVHGHQVGGTNPSLVEALGASNPVIAHDNPFNRWVAGPGACYFNGAASFASLLDELEGDATRLQAMSAASAARHREAFTGSRFLVSMSSCSRALQQDPTHARRQ